jgi:hypothetical protein
MIAVIFGTEIKGVGYHSGAREILRRCVRTCDELRLQRESANKFDRRAISIWGGTKLLG